MFASKLLVSQSITCRQVTSRTLSTLPPLPPPEKWRHVFSTYHLMHRVTVNNPATATRLAESFLNNPQTSSVEKEKGPGKVVIEAFPGPGCLTRALLSLPPSRLRKLIVLEDVPQYLKQLKILEEHDPRVKVIPLSGFHWSTYNQLGADGLLDDVRTVSWDDDVQPDLHFISHIPHAIMGDQILAQFFRCIPDRSWLFKYGRVPMSLILTESLWQRSNAKIKSSARCKLSVIAEAVADLSLSMSPSALAPYEDHFHPTVLGAGRKSEARRAGIPFVSVNLTPLKNPHIDKGVLDKWDFVLRRLFVLKSTPLKKAINSLAPGATSLLKKISSPEMPPENRVDITKQVRHLGIKEWTMLVKAFDEWPFAPEDLAITDALFKDIEKD